MKRFIAPVLASVAVLGVVGGFAASQAFKPIEQPKPQVQLVQPASEVVTPEPVATTTKATVAPKPVVKKAVPSKVKASTSAATVQKKVTVSEQTEPEPQPANPPAKPIKPRATPPASE